MADPVVVDRRLRELEREVRRLRSVSSRNKMFGDLDMGGHRIVNLGKEKDNSDATTKSGGGGGTTDHGALTGLADDDHTQYLLINGTRALSANWDAGSFGITAETLTSDIATGTAPLTVASTTLVSNLNADLLDGNEATAFATASHNHAASEITSGTLVHERGGLEADVSAFAGLVKITGGATSAVTVTAAGEAILDDASASAQRTTLGLVIGTDVQAEDATLSSIAALGTAADKIAYTTAIDTWAEAALTSFARTILDDADAATVRATIGAGTGDGDALVANPLSQFAATTSAQLAGVISDETGSGLLVFGSSPTIVTPTIASFANAAHDHTNAAGGAQLDHTTALTNVGSNTHATIDTHLAASNPHSGSQPLDSTLTSIAALGTAADKMAYTTGVDTWAEAAITTAGRALIDDASASAQRTTLGLVIGTDVQAQDAELAAIAGLTSAADRLPYFTGSGTASLATFTSFARTILDDADAATVRATIGAGTGDGDALVANPLSQFAATTSAQLAGVISDETGSGLLVFNDSPTIVTPTIASFANSAHDHENAAGGATLDHGLALTGLTDDDHTQYALLAGRSGGQTLIGGTASGEDLTLQSSAHATKGSIIFGAAGTSVYDEVNDRLGIGVAAPTAPLSATSAPTGTSGAIRGSFISLTATPSSASTAFVIGADVVGNTATGATTKANQFIGGRYLLQRNATDSGAITQMIGLNLQALNNVSLGTGQGSVSTQLVGANMQAADNSSTTTLTTSIDGGKFAAQLGTATVATRVITNLEAGKFSTIVSAGSTSTTVTNLRGIYVDCGNTDSGSLNRTGTITNAVGVDVTGFTTAGIFGSGLTFTNPPEQIRLDSMTIANSIGIRQQGATPHNRFQGFVTIGADAAPTTSCALEISSTTGALLLPRMTTTQRNALTATNGQIIYNTTTAVIEGYEGGAWVNL